MSSIHFVLYVLGIFVKRVAPLSTISRVLGSRRNMNPKRSAQTMNLLFDAQSTPRISLTKGFEEISIFLVSISQIRTVLSAPADTNLCELGEAHAAHNSCPKCPYNIRVVFFF